MSNAPVLIAYSVRDGSPGEQSAWTRLDAAWPHDKGAGLTVILEVLPLNFDGRIVLVEPNYDIPAPFHAAGPPRPK